MNDIPSEMRQEYNRYINSQQWKQKRALALKAAQYRCQHCGFSKWTKTLEVHHLTYERLGAERPDDLIVLCEECHKKADEARARMGRKKSQEALDDARFYGWGRKVYGDEWESTDIEEARERYDEWQEKRANQW
jgi:5-methylcytosine-specific restriction endonuclease McrA